MYEPATTLLHDLVLADETLVASELTRFELLAGVRPGEGPALEAMFTIVDWVPVTEETARRAGDYARSYRRSHSGIGVIDYLIAATAAILQADLLTLNVRHFPMVDGLQPPYDYG